MSEKGQGQLSEDTYHYGLIKAKYYVPRYERYHHETCLDCYADVQNQEYKGFTINSVKKTPLQKLINEWLVKKSKNSYLKLMTKIEFEFDTINWDWRSSRKNNIAELHEKANTAMKGPEYTYWGLTHVGYLLSWVDDMYDENEDLDKLKIPHYKRPEEPQFEFPKTAGVFSDRFFTKTIYCTEVLTSMISREIELGWESTEKLVKLGKQLQWIYGEKRKEEEFQVTALEMAGQFSTVTSNAIIEGLNALSEENEIEIDETFENTR